MDEQEPKKRRRKKGGEDDGAPGEELAFDFRAQQYTVTHPTFEGPLDILLDLIREHRLDVFDIPMKFITDKYLEYLDVMKQLNIDVASEYLRMAATLVYIKSRMMLPVPEAGEEDEEVDPRDELVAKLLTYQQFKDAAAQVAKRPQLGRDLFVRASRELLEFDVEDAPMEEVGVFYLVKAFLAVQRRIRSDITQEITAERVTIAQRIFELIDTIRELPEIQFSELLREGQTAGEIIITFLAVLEMAKLKMIRVFQVERDGEIYLKNMIEPADFDARRAEIQRIEYR